MRISWRSKLSNCMKSKIEFYQSGVFFVLWFFEVALLECRTMFIQQLLRLESLKACCTCLIDDVEELLLLFSSTENCFSNAAAIFASNFPNSYDVSYVTRPQSRHLIMRGQDCLTHRKKQQHLEAETWMIPCIQSVSYISRICCWFIHKWTCSYHSCIYTNK